MRTSFIPFVALGLGLVGCSKGEAMPKPAASQVPGAVHADVVTVSTRAVPKWLTLTGQLKGGHETDLAANASGKVTRVLVERGATIKAGAPVAVLDTRAAVLSAAEARTAMESAAAVAESANVECVRTRALAEKGAFSRQELDRIETQCRTSELAASAAKVRTQIAAKNVGDGVIRSPFSGSVADRYLEVGEYVRPDTRVARLVELSELRLEITVPEVHIAAAVPGARVRFTVAGYPGRAFDATVKYVAASVRPTTRDLVVEAVVDKPDIVLRPGMFAPVQLAVGQQTVPVVPRRALLDRENKHFVFVLVDGSLQQRVVQIGEESGNDVAVLRGVSEGERVVAAPSAALRNGQRVL